MLPGDMVPRFARRKSLLRGRAEEAGDRPAIAAGRRTQWPPVVQVTANAADLRDSHQARCLISIVTRSCQEPATMDYQHWRA